MKKILEALDKKIATIKDAKLKESLKKDIAIKKKKTILK